MTLAERLGDTVARITGDEPAPRAAVGRRAAAADRRRRARATGGRRWRRRGRRAWRRRAAAGPDDLKLIKGVGPVLEALLHAPRLLPLRPDRGLDAGGGRLGRREPRGLPRPGQPRGLGRAGAAAGGEGETGTRRRIDDDGEAREERRWLSSHETRQRDGLVAGRPGARRWSRRHPRRRADRGALRPELARRTDLRRGRLRRARLDPDRAASARRPTTRWRRPHAPRPLRVAARRRPPLRRRRRSRGARGAGPAAAISERVRAAARAAGEAARAATDAVTGARACRRGRTGAVPPGRSRPDRASRCRRTIAAEPARPAGARRRRARAAADDLKRIKGVGPKLEELLHALGFYHFDQIAAWSAGGDRLGRLEPRGLQRAGHPRRLGRAGEDPGRGRRDRVLAARRQGRGSTEARPRRGAKGSRRMLADKDRIFTNLYGMFDRSLAGRAGARALGRHRRADRAAGATRSSRR